VASNSGPGQQVIVATSEEEANLKPLLATLPHQFISFKERIVRPLAARTEAEPAPVEADDDEAEIEDIEMPWEVEAHAAVKRAIESFDWDPHKRTISFRDFNGETHKAGSYDELYAGLSAVARDGWLSLVPFEEGDPVFQAAEGSIVEHLLAPAAAELHVFFEQSGGAKPVK
jgi:hypothetical protein